MTSDLDVVFAGVLAVLGIVLLARARGGFAAAREVLARRTRPVASLGEGAAVELAGTLHASSEGPLQSLIGRACVVEHVRVEVLVGNGRSAQWKTTDQRTRVARAELRDASGACVVALEGAEILGEIYRETVGRGRTTVTVVPDGARVLVLGEAHLAGVESGTGYRDVAPRYAIGPGAARGVLVSTAGHTATLWQTAWPALATAACGALLLGYAATLAVLSARLGVLIR